MRKYLMIGALALVAALGLSGCDAVRLVTSAQTTTVGAQTVADARNTLMIIEGGYVVTLRGMQAYVKRPPCSLPNAPAICASTPVVKQFAKAQLATRATLDSLEEVVLNATESSTLLDTAIAAAKNAYAAFQGVAITYKIKE